MRFKVRATNDAHIALSTCSAECDPMYEIYIGGWGNQRSVIRKNRMKPDKAEVPTPNILNGGEFRTFWVRWDNNSISAGAENNSQPFISWTDTEHVPVRYVGVATGWGASGSWIIHQGAPLPGYGGPQTGQFQPQFGGQPQYGGQPQQHGGFGAPQNFTQGGGGYGNQHWVEASGGYVPPNSFVGGEDGNEPLYVVRCKFQGGVIPGKLVPRHKTAYVPWGGVENACHQYDVLADFGGRWVPCSGNNIPPNAVSGGQSEDGEPLYLGRVRHQGSITVGKVQRSHGVCYIPFAGQELSFPQYEILIA